MGKLLSPAAAPKGRAAAVVGLGWRKNDENGKGARRRRPKISSFIEELAPEGAPTTAPKGRSRYVVGSGCGVLLVIPAEQARAAAKRTAADAHPDAPRLRVPPRCGLGGGILSVPRSHRRLPLCSTCCLPWPPTWGTCGGLIIV